MAGMTMIVFEIDGREVMMSDAESIHNAMTNGTVRADTMVTVYLSDGAKLLKPAAQHKQLAPYFPVAEQPETEMEPAAGHSKLTPVEDEAPLSERQPARQAAPQSTAERLKALEEEIAANPQSAANRAWAPRVETARPMPTRYDAPQHGSAPSDIRNLGQRPRNRSGKSRVTAAVLALLFGGLGVHKFYMDKPRAGWIMLALFVFGMITFGTFLWVAPTIALIEGILYLTKSEEEFEDQYLNSDKEWF